jgi:tetratricopeptide (TPR) repeat protein
MGGLLVTALLLASDFWPRVLPDPAEEAMARGSRLLVQAAEVCGGRCSEGMAGWVLTHELLVQAVAAFRSASARRPSDPEPPYFLAQALQELKDYPGAIAALEDARRRRPDGARAGEIAFHLGVAHSRLGQFARAADEYGLALRLAQDPYGERAVPYINRAESLMALGRLEEALPLYRRGIEATELAMQVNQMVSESQAVHLLGLAVALDRDEQGQNALAAARHALELDASLRRLHDPSTFFVPEGDIHYYEAVVALARGELASATEAFREFVRTVPQSPYVARARAHLVDLGARSPRELLGPLARPPITGRIVGGVFWADGPLTVLQVDAAFRPLYADMGACLRHAGHADSDRVAIRIDGHGVVTRVKPKSDSAAVRRCVEGAVRSVRLPPPHEARDTDAILRMYIR